MNGFLDCLTSLLLNKRRIDHNPMYVCIMLWDMFAGTFAVYIGLPDAAMTHMSEYGQRLICWLMFSGGLTCVGGIVMGTKIDPGYWIRTWWRMPNRVDLRHPYLLGMLGTPMLMVSFFYYSVAILAQTPWHSTMASEASLAMAVGVGVTVNFIRFGLEIRNINARLPALVAQEIGMRMSERDRESQ
jgi:hypothetical protein